MHLRGTKFKPELDFDKLSEDSFSKSIEAYKRFQSFFDSGLQDKTCSGVFEYAMTPLHDYAKSKQIKLKINNEKILNQSDMKLFLPNYQIYTIFSNVIHNAIKYTPENGKVNVSFKLIKIDKWPHLNFKVSDSGIGIPEDQIEFVKKGNRAQNAIESGIEGTGFGLKRVCRYLDNAAEELQIVSPAHNKTQNAKYPGTEISCNIPLTKN